MEVCKNTWTVSIMEGLLLEIAHTIFFMKLGDRDVGNPLWMLVTSFECWCPTLPVMYKDSGHIIVTNTFCLQHRSLSSIDFSFVGDKVKLLI